MKKERIQPGADVHREVLIIGKREIEGAIRGIEKNPKLKKLNKGEKEVLRKLGPTIFLRGFLWTLDNIALRDDPKVAEFEEILLNLANGTQETVDTAYKIAVEVAIKRGFLIKEEREERERSLQATADENQARAMELQGASEAQPVEEGEPTGGSCAGSGKSDNQQAPEEDVEAEDGSVEERCPAAIEGGNTSGVEQHG